MEKSRIKGFKREHALTMPKVPSLACITVFVGWKVFLKKIILIHIENDFHNFKLRVTG